MKGRVLSLWRGSRFLLSQLSLSTKLHLDIRQCQQGTSEFTKAEFITLRGHVGCIPDLHHDLILNWLILGREGERKRGMYSLCFTDGLLPKRPPWVESGQESNPELRTKSRSPTRVEGTTVPELLPATSQDAHRQEAGVRNHGHRTQGVLCGMWVPTLLSKCLPQS